MKNRIWAALLALCMVLALLPGMALAAENDDPSVPAAAEKEDYHISVPSFTNGSVTPSVRNAEEGDLVSLYVTADEGYELDTLTVTDTRSRNISCRSMGDNAYSFKMPNASVKVEAKFKAVETATVPGTGSDTTNDEIFNSLGTPGIAGIVLNPAAMPFTDVNSNDWFYNNVEYM